jgi:hypothetical protein
MAIKAMERMGRKESEIAESLLLADDRIKFRPNRGAVDDEVKLNPGITEEQAIAAFIVMIEELSKLKDDMVAKMVKKSEGKLNKLN